MKRRLWRESKIKEVLSVIYLILAILAVLLLPGISLAQTVEGASSFIHTPLQLSNWLSTNFRYEMEMPDHWQKPSETIKLKKGDCEDFAILTQAVLKQLGIESDIVIVKFKGLNLTHAICVFKSGEVYKFFSNQKLFNTKAASVIGAVEKEYPDWESIIFTNADKETLKIVSRDNQKGLQQSIFAAAAEVK